MHFLDTRTADFDDPGLSALLDVMIRAYDDEVEALAIAGQVGLLRADIARYPKLRYTWRSILEEAAGEGQLRQLVDTSLQDPSIRGWHGRIREIIAIPSGPVAKRTARPPKKSAADGRKPTVGDRAPLWTPGTNITVSFIDGSPTLRTKVAKAASKWLEYANLKFVFVDHDGDADVRVTFTGEGSWAYQGRSCLDVPKGEPTVTLGWLRDDTDKKELERVALHEFGHVIGLQHEHGNPASTIDWDRAAVYDAYGAPPNNWSREMIDKTIFAIWPPSYFPVRKVFDRSSIMMFPQDAKFLARGRAIGWNYRLSPIDKQFAAALYPLREGR